MTFDFGQVIAHVCASTGWTWDYVAEHIDLVGLQGFERQLRDQQRGRWIAL